MKAHFPISDAVRASRPPPYPYPALYPACAAPANLELEHRCLHAAGSRRSPPPPQIPSARLVICCPARGPLFSQDSFPLQFSAPLGGNSPPEAGSWAVNRPHPRSPTQLEVIHPLYTPAREDVPVSYRTEQVSTLHAQNSPFPPQRKALGCTMI